MSRPSACPGGRGRSLASECAPLPRPCTGRSFPSLARSALGHALRRPSCRAETACNTGCLGRCWGSRSAQAKIAPTSVEGEERCALGSVWPQRFFWGWADSEDIARRALRHPRCLASAQGLGIYVLLGAPCRLGLRFVIAFSLFVWRSVEGWRSLRLPARVSSAHAGLCRSCPCRALKGCCQDGSFQRVAQPTLVHQSGQLA